MPLSTTCCRTLEINPIHCEACGVEMIAVAAIIDDRELGRLLAHAGLPAGFPKTKPARAPPLPFGEDSQVDLTEGYPEEMPLPHAVVRRPVTERWQGIDPEPPSDWATP